MYQQEGGCNFVKFEECQDKKTCIEILDDFMLFPSRKCVWPCWVNSGFQKRTIFRPGVNVIYLLRGGRIPSQHFYFYCWLISLCSQKREIGAHVSRHLGMGEFRTGCSLWKRRNEHMWKKCVRTRGVHIIVICICFVYPSIVCI